MNLPAATVLFVFCLGGVSVTCHGQDLRVLCISERGGWCKTSQSSESLKISLSKCHLNPFE